MEKKINIVVVSHPDDEILGFGGTGFKLVKAGEIVQPIILCGEVVERSHRPQSSDLYEDMISANKTLGFNKPVIGKFPNVRMNNVDHVEIVRFIEEQVMKYEPNRIFTHHPSDLNDDHIQTMKACMVASRLFQRHKDLKPIETIYFMETLSSTDWSFPSIGNPFIPDTFSDITDTIEHKLKALAKYKNVMRDLPHPRSEHVLKGHAAYRGGQSSYKYAEAFQTAFKRNI